MAWQPWQDETNIVEDDARVPEDVLAFVLGAVQVDAAALDIVSVLQAQEKRVGKCFKREDKVI